MTIDVDWSIERDAYDHLFERLEHTNLLQSWAWGEAKAAVEGWRPRRAIISECGHLIGLAQVLEKRLGPLRLARLNRGPLWLDSISDEQRLAGLAALRRRWRWFRLGGMLAAPELPGADAMTVALRRHGWIRRQRPVWCSAWLDLRPAAETLRKSLNGKWRNMLVNAEKAGLRVERLTGRAGLEWLLPHYRDMSAAKGFSGIDPTLALALADALPVDQLVTLAAFSGDDAVAAVLIVRHGAAATYLIGWSNDRGRALRGTHLLLWQAVVHLREQHCLCLDLGGIDDVLTPGIASFKRGLKGTEYTLAGEWLGL